MRLFFLRKNFEKSKNDNFFWKNIFGSNQLFGQVLLYWEKPRNKYLLGRCSSIERSGEIGVQKVPKNKR